MRKAEHYIDLEVFERAKVDGVLVNLLKEVYGYCFQLLVQPELSHGRQRTEYVVSEIRWRDAWWKKSWWCKLLAWLYRKTPIKIRYCWPRLLCYLKNARLPTSIYRQVHLKNNADALARIIIMIEELRRRGEAPSVILVAECDFHEITHQFIRDYGYGDAQYYEGYWPATYGPQLFGVKVQMSPFLAENCVIVA